MTRIYEVVSTRQIEKGGEDREEVKRQGYLCRQVRQIEAKESVQVEDDQVKGKIIFTRIGKVISTRQRYDCNKDRQSDIDKAKRRGEEYHREVNIRKEENCNKEKEKTITKRRFALILMVKEN